MARAARKPVAWVTAALAIALALWVLCLLSVGKRSPIPPPAPTNAAPSPTLESSAAAATDQVQAALLEEGTEQAVKDATSGLTITEWRVRPQADIKSPNPPDIAQKALQIVGRNKENFSKIKTLAFHEVDTRTYLRPTTPAEQENAKRSQKDIRVEIQRDPPLLRVKGTDGRDVLDAKVTPVWTTQAGVWFGFADLRLKGELAGSVDDVLRVPLTISENVPADTEVAKALEKEGWPAEDARYDVVNYTNPSGGTRSYWFRKDTGMLEAKFVKNAPEAAGVEPTTSVLVFKYQRAGEIYYPVIVDRWIAKRGDLSSTATDFEGRYKTEVSDLVINGFPAEK